MVKKKRTAPTPGFGRFVCVGARKEDWEPVPFAQEYGLDEYEIQKLIRRLSQE